MHSGIGRIRNLGLAFGYWLLAISQPSAAGLSADPEGGAHGCAPFSDRAMDGESENPRSPKAPIALCRERHFSLVRFFCASKRNELARIGGETSLDQKIPETRKRDLDLYRDDE